MFSAESATLLGRDYDGKRLSLLIRGPTTPDSRQMLQEQSGTIRLLVAMPAYNEETYIAWSILSAKQHADVVLVIDEGSEDETNRGYGGALQAVFATARNLGVKEFVTIDADGQHNSGEISRQSLDVSRADRRFGFRARTSSEDGLKTTIAWYWQAVQEGRT